MEGYSTIVIVENSVITVDSSGILNAAVALLMSVCLNSFRFLRSFLAGMTP